MKYLLSVSTLFLLISLPALAQKDTLKELTFTFTENLPAFPGGEPALMKYLHKHLSISDSTMHLPVPKINLSFMINEQGVVLMGTARLNNKPLDTMLAYDKMNYRLLQNMPRWTPARQGGRAVKFLYQLPINVCLSQE